MNKNKDLNEKEESSSYEESEEESESSEYETEESEEYEESEKSKESEELDKSNKANNNVLINNLNTSDNIKNNKNNNIKQDSDEESDEQPNINEETKKIYNKISNTSKSPIIEKKEESDSSTEFIKEGKLYNEKELYNNNKNNSQMNIEKSEDQNIVNINKNKLEPETAEINLNIISYNNKDIINNNESIIDIKIESGINKKSVTDDDNEYLNELLNLDVQNTQKENLLNMLMKDNCINKSINNVTNDSKSNNYECNNSIDKKNVVDRLTQKNNINNLIDMYKSLNKKPSSSTINNSIFNLENNNLEFKNLEEAKNKLKENIVNINNNNSNNNTNDINIHNLLLSDEDLNKIINNKCSTTDNKDNFIEKIKKYEEKKQDKLKKIKNQVKEEEEKLYTFAPNNLKKCNNKNIVNNKDNNYNYKRSINDFLEDQNRYIKKIQDKKELLKEIKEKEENEKLKKPKEKISKYKIELNKKIGSSQDRLFIKKNKLLDNYVNNKKDVLNTNNNNIENKTKKNKKNIDEINSNLYNKAIIKKEIKQQQLLEKSNECNTKKIELKTYVNNTNKLLFDKFLKQFLSFVKILADEQLIDINDYNNNNPIHLNLISFHRLLELCCLVKNNLNYMLTPYTDNLEKKEFKLLINIININKYIDKENNNNNNSVIFKYTENNEVKINLDCAFTCIIIIIGLYEYYVIKDLELKTLDSSYYNYICKQYNEKIVIKDVINLGGIDSNYNYILPMNLIYSFNKEFKTMLSNWKEGQSFKSVNKKSTSKISIINNKLNSKIAKSKEKKRKNSIKSIGSINSNSVNSSNLNHNNKYNNFIIDSANISKHNKKQKNSPLKTTHINKNILKSPLKQSITNINTNINKPVKKQPTQNISTNILSYDKIKEEYDKLYTVDDLELTDIIPNVDKLEKKPTNYDKFNIITLKKKNKEKLNEINKEIKETNEIKQTCTFKPQINTNSINIVNNKDYSLKDRIDIIYNKGKKTLLNKKDKSNIELEEEKYLKECTFKPNINDYNSLNMNQQLISEVNDTIINSEKQNKLLLNFNERYKKARQEKEYKDKQLNRFCTNYKNEEKPMFFNKDEKQLELNNKNLTESRIGKNNLNQNNTNDKKKNRNINKNNSNNNINNANDKLLLVIDVNLDNNINTTKKQIFVYEGDTPEKLSSDFALQNGNINCIIIYLLIFY